MKKLFVSLFLLLLTITSYAEKTGEEVLQEFREKIVKREEEKLRQEQEKIRQEEEAKRQKEEEEAREKENKEKESMALIKEKRREWITEPLEEKFSRADDRAGAYQKALEVAEARMSFVRVKEKNNGEEGDTLSKRYEETYRKTEEIENKRQEILREREELQAQLKKLDELETKVKDW